MTEPIQIAEGHWGRVFDLGDNTVIKCFRSEAHPKAVQLEADVANLAAGLGVPTPAVIGVQNDPGSGVIRFEKITGDTVARYVLERPWKLVWATRQMAKIFAQIHTIKVTRLPSIKRALAARIQRAPELSDAQKTIILDRLASLEDDDKLCHYDFHPGNVMVADSGCSVIDWGGATHGNPIADVAHAYVLNKVDGVLQDVPWFNRVLIRSLRGLYIELFLYFYALYSPEHSYRSLKASVRSWVLPVAAARLASYGDFEVKALLRIVRASL